MVNEIGVASNQRLENQLTELTSLVRQLAVEQHQPAMAAKVCGICTFVEHPTDMCLTFQETESDQPENVRAIVWKTTISARTTSRAICDLESRTCPEHASRISRLPTAESAISSTTFPTTTTTVESAYSRKLSISRGPDEAACNQQPGVPTIYELQQHAIPAKRDRHHPRPQNTDWTLPKSAEVNSEPNANSQPRPETTVSLSFPNWTISARKPDSDEELLKMFRKVEINIPLLDAIKQIPKYAKFLKELGVHKRKKIKRSREIGGIVSVLTRNEEFTVGAQALPKKCRDPGIFSVPCTIGECTFADAMLDLGASINVMPASIYRSLNFGDLEPTRMTIQLANRSIVQPLGVLEDVLVQDETSGKESTLILGRPFLMTIRTKIDMHAGTLSMEFGDTLHPTEDHSLFGIDLIDELVEEYLQLDTSSEDIENCAGSTNLISCLWSLTEKANYEEVQDLPYFVDNHNDIANLDFEVELSTMLDQVYNLENLECTNSAKVVVAEIKSLFSTQLATIFTAEIKSAREGQVKEKMKVNSAEKLSSKADMLAEAKLTSEDYKQTRAEFTVPFRSDSEAAQEVDADSNSTRIELTNGSRPK
ncbi:hypothetical protein CR513_36160, partial [Mucuna pruriens]